MRTTLALAIVCASLGCHGKEGPRLTGVVLSPSEVTIATGGFVMLRLTSVRSDGIREPVDDGEARWTVTGASLDYGELGVALVAPAIPGTALVVACLGGLCAESRVTVVAEGTLVVHARDAREGSPVEGATVTVLGAGASTVTDAAGRADLAGAFSGPIAIEVTAPGHWPVYVLDATVRDVMAPLRPRTIQPRGRLRGTVAFESAFGDEAPPAGSLWLAFVSRAVTSAELSTWGASSFLSRDVVPLDVGGATYLLPENLHVFGLTDSCRLDAEVGRVPTWAAGVEGPLSDIFELVDQGLDFPEVFATAFPAWYDGAAFAAAPVVFTTGEDVVVIYPLDTVDKARLRVRLAQEGFGLPATFAAFEEVEPEAYVPIGMALGDADPYVPDDVRFLGTGLPSAVVAFSESTGRLLTAVRRGLSGARTIDLGPLLAAPPRESFTMIAPGTFAHAAVPRADLMAHRIVRVATGPLGIVDEWDVYAPASRTSFDVPAVVASNAAIHWTSDAVALESFTFDALLAAPEGAPTIAEHATDASRVAHTVRSF